MSKALRTAPLLALTALAMAFLVAPAFAATTYTVSVQTDAPSYSASQAITISGVVSPAPGANTAVVITIRNPSNNVVDISDDPVNPSTGAYTQVTVAGGTANWIAGTYTVNATWGGNSSTATKTTTFNYSPTATSTTTSTSSTTTTTSTSSTSTSKTTSSSSSTTTTTTLPPTTTSSSTSTLLPPVSSSTSSTTSTSTTESSGGGLGSLTYVIVAAVVIVVAGLGIVMWRRKVASGLSGKSTAP